MPTTPTPVLSHFPDISLVVRKVRGMGRGVFAGRTFLAAEEIEVCPVLLLDGVATEEELPGGLRNYVFKWGGPGNRLAVALGYGSLYNHSPEPNAEFTIRRAGCEIVFRAIRDIEMGEQIFVDYGWDEADYSVFRQTS